MSSAIEPREEPTDAELVDAARRTPAAFRAIVERYEAPLRRYVMRLVSASPDEANDILQETFIKAYRNINGVDTKLKFSSWLYRIAHNEAISQVRRTTARPTVRMDDDEQLLERLVADTDVVRDAQQGELREFVARALTTLRPEYRAVLTLRYFEDRDYNDIADILRRPPGTVATLLHRAKRELREQLATTHTHYA